MPLISCTFAAVAFPALPHCYAFHARLLAARRRRGQPTRAGGKEAARGDHLYHHSDIAQNVAGDAAVVESITKPGAEIHDYQPTPRDIVKAQHADLIPVERHEPGTLVPALLREHQAGAGGGRDRRHHPTADPRSGPYNGNPNPHAWMSPSNALCT